MTHSLKIWPQFFEAVRLGIKTFEYRKNDRLYRDGDTLVLQEWDPETQQYTGREITVEVPYVLHIVDQFNRSTGQVIMSIKPQSKSGEEK